MSFSTLQYSDAAKSQNVINAASVLPLPPNDSLLGMDNWLMPTLQMDDNFMFATSFPQRLGVSSDMELPALPDRNVDHPSFDTGAGSTTTPHKGCLSAYGDNMNGEAYGGATFDYGSPILYPSSTNNGGECWGAQNQSSIPKIGRYSVEERRERILRYLKKRNQRNFNKTIKYACRKTLADRRARVRGRFAKNINEEESEVNKINNKNNSVDTSDRDGGDQQVPSESSSSYNYNNNHNNINYQMNEDQIDEEWLQEAMASLMYDIQYVPTAATAWRDGAATSS